MGSDGPLREWVVWVVGVLHARESRAVESRPSRKEKMQGDRKWVGEQEPWRFGALLLDFLLSTL